MNPESPLHRGVGLAAVILGAACVPVAVYVGVQSLAVNLPVFGIWYFLPLTVIAIALGIYASHFPTGIAGAILGVVSLLICMGFIVFDRVEGAELRAQLKQPSISTSLPPGLSSDQLLRALHPTTTNP